MKALSWSSVLAFFPWLEDKWRVGVTCCKKKGIKEGSNLRKYVKRTSVFEKYATGRIINGGTFQTNVHTIWSISAGLTVVHLQPSLERNGRTWLELTEPLSFTKPWEKSQNPLQCLQLLVDSMGQCLNHRHSSIYTSHDCYMLLHNVTIMSMITIVSQLYILLCL